MAFVTLLNEFLGKAAKAFTYGVTGITLALKYPGGGGRLLANLD